MTGILNSSRRKTQGLQIEPDSQVGVLKVNVAKSNVSVQIVTLKAEKVVQKGDTQSQYLYTWLQFPFKDLETMDLAAIKSIVYAAIVPEKPLTTANSAVVVPNASAGATPAPTNSAKTASSGNQLVGRTTDEVKELLGPPSTTLDAGNQTILVYPGLGLRLAVRDGKVVSVQ